YAGLWCRIDGPDLEQLGFDNMAVRHGADRVYKKDDRGVRGTTPWGRYQVEVDVDTRAVTVVFGGLLVGDGTAWFDDLAIEVDGQPLTKVLASEPTREQVASGLGESYSPFFSVNQPPHWTSLRPYEVSFPGEVKFAWRTRSQDEVVIFLQKPNRAVSP